MKKETNKGLLKKVLAIGGTALIAGTLGAVGHALTTEPTEVIKEITVEVEKIVEKEVPVTVEVEKIVEKNVTVEVPVEVEVPVDNENLDLVLDHIYDNEGNVDYLTEDLDDDEIAEIVDRIGFINDIKKLAADEVEKELFDEIDNTKIELNDGTEYEFNDKLLERLRIDDDFDEILIEDVEFDVKDAEVKVTFKFEDDDDIKFEGSAIVEFKDGDIKDFGEILINEI